MARIKIQSIVEKLDYDMKRALEDAVQQTDNRIDIDRSQLFRAFKRAVGRKFSTWVTVPDDYVEKHQ